MIKVFVKNPYTRISNKLMFLMHWYKVKLGQFYSKNITDCLYFFFFVETGNGAPKIYLIKFWPT